MSVIDTDTLPAAQYLILEVLAARYRTSETHWTFPARLRPQMEALETLGLIRWKSGVAPKTVIAWLTEAGRNASMSETYVPPNEREVRGCATSNEVGRGVGGDRLCS